MDRLKQMDQQYIMDTYARFDISLIRGEGAVAYDDQGKRYLDFTAGIGVNSLGFCPPDWVKAVSQQAATLQHTGNYYITEPATLLAKKITELTGYDKVFFANSGAEANEGAIKIARKYGLLKGGKICTNIVCLEQSFHGRTVTTLSATGQEAMHHSFGPLTPGFRFMPPNGIEAMDKVLDDTVCAVLVEPILGEGGVVELSESYLKTIVTLCQKKKILLIADEVQTGVGRTGTFLATEQTGIFPDITTLAKGLGGGLPIGAIACKKTVADVLKVGDHGSTFGGNPVCCAAGLVCVNTIGNEFFLQQVQQKEKLIRSRLQSIEEVRSIEGRGLMLGITLKTKQAKKVAKDCAEEGLLVLTAKHKVRLLPPLNISMEHLEEGLQILWHQLNLSD